MINAILVLLRIATLAPDGTAWAHTAKAFSTEVERQTGGVVRFKWYFGGMAGDETTVIDRMRRGQLDGSALSHGCDQLAPSLRVGSLPGLFQSREEWRYTLNRLRPRVEREMAQAGFVGLTLAGFGNDILFMREPVRNLNDLRASRLFVSELASTLLDAFKQMGLRTVALPFGEAVRAFDHGAVDGFVATPTAALAFQLSSRARYFSELRIAYAPACFVMSAQSFGALPVAAQQSIRAAAAAMGVRFEDVGRAQDDQLLGGLFEKQGLTRVPVSETFRSEFFEGARRARDQVVSRTFLDDVLGPVQVWLADFRAEHGQ